MLCGQQPHSRLVWLRAACCHRYCRARLNLKLAPNGDWAKFEMVELIAAGLWASSVVWLLARAVRQHGAYLDVEPERISRIAPRVAVVVPARDEGDTIGDCVAGLAAQDYPPEQLAIFVVDDNSSDGTAAVVRGLARRLPVRLVKAGVRPRAWAGKPWACNVGAAAAASTDAEWLCFVDADVVPRSTLIASAVAVASRRGLDMLSLAPAQRITGVGQALIMPVAFLLLAVTQDLRQINDPATPAAAANGQFILIRRSVYERVGGHAAIAGEIADDKALAERIKRAGFRLALCGGERLCECRMYRSFTGCWHGLTRNVAYVLSSSEVALLAATAGILAAAAAPLLPWWTFHAAEAARGWHWIAFGGAVAASSALVITHVRAARYFHVSGLYGLGFPLGYLIGSAILVHSVYRWHIGRFEWKGRAYGPRTVEKTRAAAYPRVNRPRRR